MRKSALLVVSIVLLLCLLLGMLLMAQSDIKKLFEDDFGRDKQQWQQVSGVWETRKGHLLQTTDDPRHLNAIRYVQTPRFSDGTIETLVSINPKRPAQWTDTLADQELKMNIRSFCGAGIVFRMKDPKNFYMFRLAGEEGGVLGRMVEGQWNDRDLANPRFQDILGSQRIEFGLGKYYRLKVECRGDRIKCYINDEVVCTAQDSTFSLGQVGVVTFKTGADFDWFKVQEFTR